MHRDVLQVPSFLLITQVWDLRKDEEPTLVLKGHSDTVTGMRVSPDGSHLLTNAMDGTLRMWDMRPFAPQNRCVKVFNGEPLLGGREGVRVDHKGREGQPGP